MKTVLFDDGPLDLIRMADGAEIEAAVRRWRLAGHGFREMRYRELVRVVARQLERNIQQETSR